MANFKNANESGYTWILCMNLTTLSLKLFQNKMLKLINDTYRP